MFSLCGTLALPESKTITGWPDKSKRHYAPVEWARLRGKKHRRQILSCSGGNMRGRIPGPLGPAAWPAAKTEQKEGRKITAPQGNYGHFPLLMAF
eukprot:1158443-Pelagomonas_calceolata.AAC.18